MANATSQLIDQLLEMNHHLTLLMIDAKNTKDVADLADQRNKIQRQIADAIEKQFQENDAGFKKAIAGLKGAVASVEDALKHIATIDQTIKVVAGVIQAVGTVIAAG